LTDPITFTPSQLRRIADILESNNDQHGFDFWSAVAAAETEDSTESAVPAPFQTHMTDVGRIRSIAVLTGAEIAETYNDRMFITIPGRALVLEDSYYRQAYVLVGSDDELEQLGLDILQRTKGKLTLNQVIDEATAMGLLDDEPAPATKLPGLSDIDWTGPAVDIVDALVDIWFQRRHWVSRDDSDKLAEAELWADEMFAENAVRIHGT
jgi:hypothetical protein